MIAGLVLGARTFRMARKGGRTNTSDMGCAGREVVAEKRKEKYMYRGNTKRRWR